MDASDCVDGFARHGAAAVYLVWEYDSGQRKQALDIRYEIEEHLQREVLGERGSGNELGIVLGGAMGTGRVYIDLLIYDGPMFWKKASELLEQYESAFYFSEFRRNCCLEQLPDGKMDDEKKESRS